MNSVVSFRDFYEDRPSGGVVSSIFWDSPDLLKGLNIMFGVDEKKEKISDIVINNYGITAYFERVKNDKKAV